MADVVYVCQTFPWVTQTFAIREVAGVRAQGLDVEVVSFRRPPDDLIDDDARKLLVYTEFVPAPTSVLFAGAALRAFGRRPFAILRLASIALAARGLVRTTWRMRLRGVLAVARGAWIAAHRPDARIFHAEFPDEAATAAMVAAELSGAAFSFRSHSSYNPLQLRRKLSQARFVVADSEFTRRHYFGGVPDERVLLNRGGVTEFGPPALPGAAELRILTVGTLQDKKGHRFLLGALRRLHDRRVPFRALIVGSGPLENDVREAIEAGRLADRVSLEPYRRHDEIQRLYREHDVFALPCIVTDDGDRDGVPVVLIEAGAAGCTLVSTPVSGIPELIEDGVSGLLVPERDEAALADALSRLAADPALRRRLADGAQAVARERFDLGRNVAALAERFRQELEGTAVAQKPARG
jgi:glycosyltransferase involved in cell wall biosynthesis